MKLTKLIAVAMSVSLYSCSCDDVDLGKLEFTNELTSFLPAPPVQGKSYYIAMDTIHQKMSYVNPEGSTTVVIPVKKINYSGKFDLNSCKEYYTAEQKVFLSQVNGQNPVRLTLTYRKDASTDRFNNTISKGSVGDVLEFTVGYTNTFPEPVANGTSSISSYETVRTFLFSSATTATLDHYTYKQEFLPAVALNSVQHENVYHLYLSSPSQYRPEDQFFRDHYPALDYIEGIYVKEGAGIVYAYSFKGKQISVAVE
ncbi:hypothetical protein [Pontibacter actiniarum]|uniref:Uncharacterized protein n=1 Tax=Pontibacter actiniarum TaxID=323450 RepID=A0A1X9YW65_9BACT|nr:hypothetical protein [Pontibacter actiniarum]ARS37051.1 hypothetical protein CA264_17340 [Pontibacter actiniarum]